MDMEGKTLRKGRFYDENGCNDCISKTNALTVTELTTNTVVLIAEQ